MQPIIHGPRSYLPSRDGRGVRVHHQQAGQHLEWMVEVQELFERFPRDLRLLHIAARPGRKALLDETPSQVQQRSTRATMGTTTISETSPNESLNRTTSNSIGSERVLHVQSEKTLKEKQLSLRHALHIAPPLPVAASRCRPGRRCGRFHLGRSAVQPVHR